MKYSKHWVGFGSSVLLLTALVSGCAGTSTGTGTAPVSLQRLPAEFGDAFCDNIGSCCQAGGIAFELATCKQNITALLNQAVLMEASPNIKYDAAAAGRCLAAYASEIRTCTPNEKTISDACLPVFTGSLPGGAACTLDDECMRAPNSTADCTGAPSSPGGQNTCAVVSGGDTGPHGKQGDPCLGTCQSSDCSAVAPSGGGTAAATICFIADGIYCDATQTCQPVSEIGKVCSLGGCKSGSFCMNGVCTASQPDGAVCFEDVDCAAGSCMFADPPSSGSGAPTGICGNPVFASDTTCAGGLD